MKNLNLKEFFGSTVLAVNPDGRTTVERRSNDGHIRRHLPVGLTKLLSLFFLLTLGVGQVWGYTATFRCVPALTFGSNWSSGNTCKVKFNADYGWGDADSELSPTGLMYESGGNLYEIYSVTRSDLPGDGVRNLHFERWEGSSWKENQGQYNDWRNCSSWSNSMYYGSWGSYSYKTWDIPANTTIVWDAGNESWTTAQLYIFKDGHNTADDFTQVGSTTQFTKKYTTKWAGYAGLIIRKNNNWDAQTTNIYTDVQSSTTNITLFTYQGNKSNGKLNWQKTTNAKKATSGVKIYFDNTDAKWGEVWLKYGTQWYNRSSAAAATKVTGTDNLYVITIPNDAYYEKYYLANHYGYTGYNSIETMTNISNRINYQASNIASDITYIPSTGSGSNPKVWNTTTLSGHTRTLTITAPSNGSISATYTDENGTEQTVTSGSFTVAQTCKVTITATPNTGYALSGLTLGGASITSGAEQIIRADGTIAATFVAETTHDVTVSYKIGTRTLHADRVVAVGETTPSNISSETVDGFSFSSWSNLTSGITNVTGNTTTDPIRIKTTADASMTCNYTQWPCSLDIVPSEGATTYTSRTPMSYDATTKAYYKNVSTASSTERYRFYIDSKEYSTSGNTELVIAGTKVDANTPVQGYGSNKPSVYFNDGGTGSNITVWFDYENKKAWVTEQKHTVTISAGANGSVSPTSVSAGAIKASPTITATADEHYHLSSWTIPSGVTLASGTTTTSPITIKATASDKTVIANFAGDQYTITYKDQGNVTYSGNNEASLPKTHTYGTATALVDGSKAGYTFGGWYTDAPCTSSAGSSIGATTKTANFTLYAKWTENLTTVTLVASPAGKGTFTIGGAAATGTTAGVTTTRSVTAVPATGYHLIGTIWSKSNENISLSSATANPVIITGAGTVSETNLTATFTPNNYSVSFNANGGTGDAMSAQAFTYDAAQALSANTYTRTGYNFDGWATAAEGAKAYNPGQSVSNLTNANGGTFPLFAHWTAKSYTVTLDIDDANHGTIDGKATSASVTFDATPTAIAAGQLPTAAQGYAFMGFFTAAGGEGVQVINANGTWIASVTGYTDASGNWVRDGGITLYAYYKKAEITDLTLSASTVAPSSTFTVTPTISPTPTGTTDVCWTVLYAANDNELAPQPAISTEGTTATITAPATPGTYKVQAILHNTDCNGTELSRLTATFVVAGDHTVTVRYIGDGEQLQASTQLQANQLSWSDDITAPTVSGYTFAGWTAGEGITITGDNGDTEGTSSSNATIKVKATYAGTLTANYVETPTVYFYNNLGWSDVYVTYDAYWNDGENEGAGCHDRTYHHMTRIGETNIWYDEIPSTYTSDGFSGWAYNIAFNDQNQSGYNHFHGGNVIFRRDFDPYNTMFVPATEDVVAPYNKNNCTYYSSTFTYYDNRDQNNAVTSRDYYYNGGYWKKYNKKYSGYSLRGTFANIIGDEKNWSGEEHNLYSETTEETEDGWETSTSLKLSGNYNYYFRIYRNHLKNDQSSGYTNTGTMTVGANHANWRFETKQEWRGNNCTLSAATEGIYTFHVLFDKKGRIYVSVDYPMNVGDYRLLYKDDVHTTWHSSGTIASGNTEDIVSFFSRTSDKNPVIKWQYSTGIANNGTITWSTPADVSLTDWVGTDKVINDSAVYNFKVAYNAQSHTLALTDVKPYTGNYYIRTNSAGKYKWENYLNDPDHMMTYSEYAKTNGDYTHYWMAHVYANANVKFVIANDYSPCISDTLIQQSGDLSTTPAHVDATGNIHANANVRFMWDARNNKVQRAYLADAKEDGTEFLVLIAADDNAMKDANGNNLRQASASDEAGYNHGAPDHAVQFVDNENWIYEANVQLKPSAYVKLYANFDGGDFCYKGNSGSNFDGEEVDGKPNAIQLIGGDADLQNVRVVYDFKTDRLMAAWLPGDADITTETAINADVMIIRQHQDAGKQITFTGSGKLTDVKTVYGVMQFNRWTLNNKSTADGHAPLTGANSKSLYERALYFISFPFDVKVSEIFGFGKYWDEWYIEYYDGKSRAANGYWIDSEPNWKYVTPEMAKTFELKANQGYILGLDLDYMKDDNTTFWANDIQNVSLYFPSTTSVNNIQATSAVIPALTSDYYCKINRGTPDGDRRVKDSYWRCIGVPSYANYSNTLTDGANTIVWQTGSTLPYIYQWNMTDNTLTPQSTSNFAFLTMHAYLAQYEGAIHWSAVSATPSPVVARRTADETIQDREFRLELAQAQKMLDQTYVRLSMDEEVTTGFEFNHDLTKEINAGKANIYTYIGYEKAAANCLPMSNQTTIVPMGVQIAADGEYTFAMPEGTNGTGVTLIDNETGTRTSLALTDYTVTLGKGTYDNRFVLEFSPVAQTPTGIEDAETVNRKSSNRKLLIDGILYIVKDGQVFDARGTKVK